MSRRGASFRNRALLCELFSGPDQFQNLGIDLVKLRQQCFGSIRPQSCDRAFQFPRFDFFARAITKIAHALGVRVIVDQIYSYTSSRHPWFPESRALPEGPRGDWYEWGDARPDGSPPTNRISIFGGPAWDWDLARRQGYVTHFPPQMPHLRVQSPAVQAALLDIGHFWLERGVDGFRMDVINLAVVDSQRPDNPPSGVHKPRLPIETQQGL